MSHNFSLFKIKGYLLYIYNIKNQKIHYYHNNERIDLIDIHDNVLFFKSKNNSFTTYFMFEFLKFIKNFNITIYNDKENDIFSEYCYFESDLNFLIKNIENDNKLIIPIDINNIQILKSYDLFSKSKLDTDQIIIKKIDDCFILNKICFCCENIDNNNCIFCCKNNIKLNKNDIIDIIFFCEENQIEIFHGKINSYCLAYKRKFNSKSARK